MRRAGGTGFRRLSFSDLAAWKDDDHAAAFAALRRGAAVLADRPPKQRSLGFDAAALAETMLEAARMPALVPPGEARSFFERRFAPVEIVPQSGAGFFTGYYEPVVRGALMPSAEFAVPLLAVPDDLVEVTDKDRPPSLDPSFRFARRTSSGLVEYFDRAAIERGALAGRELELCYVGDPVDAFFIHIQGAARIDLGGGEVLRIAYAAKSGHPYTPIGRVLVERGALSPGAVTMSAIRTWLAAHRDEAGEVMAANRSFIFFRVAPVADPALGPVAAARVPLTSGRSLAVDRLLMSFHMPVWVETTLPDGGAFRRLMVAQDTGSAIVGPGRGDIFFGSGDAAGEIAGAMQAAGRFVVLSPGEMQ